MAVVYGADDREDIYKYEPVNDHPLVELARSSCAALIDSADIVCDGQECQLLPSPTLGDYMTLCPDQRFLDQSTSAFCSGTLIDDDLFLTAGHCVATPSDCETTRFVFNYVMADADDLGVIVPDDVFDCVEIVAHENTGTVDYAILRIDRSATPRFRPVPIRTAGEPLPVESDPRVFGLVTIGHPDGIPQKTAEGPEPIGATGLSGAWVTDTYPDYFESNIDSFFDVNVDSFGGNSGSGVFSFDSRGEVLFIEGVLVRGNNDYEDTGPCHVPEVCDDLSGCSGEDGEGWQEIVRSSVFSPFVPDACGDRRCQASEDEFTCPEDCHGDLDGDGVEETNDNCPGVDNPTQGDGDGDGNGDPCDCDPADPVIWDLPGEVRGLRLSTDHAMGETVLEWFPPREVGATHLYYDTLRSDLPSDFLGPAVCVETRDDSDRAARDGAVPDPGTGFHYLVRALNDCPGGVGTLGERSSGLPREGRPCP